MEDVDGAVPNYSRGLASAGWEALGKADLAIAGLVTCVDSTVGLLVLHIMHRWEWSPYMTKIPALLVTTGIAAILCSITIAMRYGMWGSDDADGGKEPVGCISEAIFLWASAGLLFGSVFLRAYRQHNILVNHDGFMWAVPAQLLFFQLLIMLPLTGYIVVDDIYDPVTQECMPESTWPELFSFTMLATLAMLSVLYAVRLWPVRNQAKDEIEAAVASSTILIMSVIVLPALQMGLENDRPGRRRAMLLTVTVSGAALFVLPPLRALIGFWRDDEEYAKSRHHGIEQNQCLTLIKHRFELRQKMNNLGRGGRAELVPSALMIIKFYRDTLDREDMKDFFLRQASTMRILSTYVRDGASHRVPLSDECRNIILSTEASSMYIFGRARDEAVELMGGEIAPSRKLGDHSGPGSTLSTNTASVSPGSSALSWLVSSRGSYAKSSMGILPKGSPISWSTASMAGAVDHFLCGSSNNSVGGNLDSETPPKRRHRESKNKTGDGQSKTAAVRGASGGPTVRFAGKFMFKMGENGGEDGGDIESTGRSSSFPDNPGRETDGGIAAPSTFSNAADAPNVPMSKGVSSTSIFCAIAPPSLASKALLAGKRIYRKDTAGGIGVVGGVGGIGGGSAPKPSFKWIFGAHQDRTNDINALFGLKDGWDSSDEENNERGKASKKAKAKSKSLIDNGQDLASAAATISNPLYGDPSRGVGRQGHRATAVRATAYAQASKEAKTAALAIPEAAEDDQTDRDQEHGLRDEKIKEEDVIGDGCSNEEKGSEASDRSEEEGSKDDNGDDCVSEEKGSEDGNCGGSPKRERSKDDNGGGVSNEDRSEAQGSKGDNSSDDSKELRSKDANGGGASNEKSPEASCGSEEEGSKDDNGDGDSKEERAKDDTHR